MSLVVNFLSCSFSTGQTISGRRFCTGVGSGKAERFLRVTSASAGYLGGGIPTGVVRQHPL